MEGNHNGPFVTGLIYWYLLVGTKQNEEDLRRNAWSQGGEITTYV
jgi:hypothetical protein